jgi:hypothetical protein
MSSVYSGEYIVDPWAVAEAILSRRRRRPSQLLEAAQVGPDRPVGTEQHEPAPGADLP